MALPLTPQQRVEQYISDWYSQWSTAKQEFGRNVDFERWGELVSNVEHDHFVKGASSGTKNAFGTPDHDPSVEAVAASNEQGDSAEVETVASGEGLTAKYRVYSLKRDENSGWLISEILHLLDPPAEAALAADEIAALLALASHDAGLAALGPETLPNEPLLFTPNRSVTLSTGESDVTRVEKLGKLNTSGVLGVFDIAYGLKRREPLERRIRAGDYTVEVVSAFDRVAAVRLILNSDSQAESWRPAKTASGNGNFGVDSGTAAIFDVDSISRLTNIDFERPLTRWSKSIEPEILSMGADNNIVMFGSGFGDGVYPCYWGIDSSGEIVSLVVDLLVLSEEVDGVWKTV